MLGFLSAHRGVGAFADQSAADETLVIPETLTDLSDAELVDLTTRANEAFTGLFDAGTADGWTADGLQQLESLTQGIEALQAESARREEVAAANAATAAELASRVRPAAEAAAETDTTGEAESEDEDDAESETTEASADAEAEVVAEAEQVAAEAAEPAAVTAAAAPVRRGATRVNLRGLSTRQTPAAARRGAVPSGVLALAAPDVPGFAQGQSLTIAQMGEAVATRLMGFNASEFARAAQSGRSIRNSYGIAAIRKPYQHIIDDGVGDASAILDAAANEKALPGGSLTASGGWCAPSETLYDLFDEGVSRDGIYSVPEVGVTRGGFRFTKGPSYADIFASTGFSYTEQQDIDGMYGVGPDGVGNGTAGTKPCFKVECTDFEEVRLQLDGLCIQAGLLMRRSYPELIAKSIQLALIAHDHRMAAKRLAAVAAGSTAVQMPANMVGATAPILRAIELQVQHYRYIHRLQQSTTLEAVFPFWVRGAIRADLSLRLGLNLQDVTDAQITSWFTLRGISPQFVYNWQDLTGAAGAFLAWPTSVKFLLYRAGEWVGGGNDVLTLDTLYDSTLLGENDYTALFTEEGWLIAHRGIDSRVIDVPICPSGEVAAGIEIECNGTATPAAP